MFDCVLLVCVGPQECSSGSSQTGSRQLLKPLQTATWVCSQCLERLGALEERPTQHGDSQIWL